MRVVLDYGGVIVEHRDEREYADLLGVAPGRDPYPGWLAYYLYRAGFLDTQDQYLELLSTLTGATAEACREYLERTWLDPQVPAANLAVIEELASRHELVVFGNMVKPWLETVLERHGVLALFDEFYVSSDLERPKPHPRGYHRCTDGVEGEIVFVSDEYNEDLLMGTCFGMTTVWVENDWETPYREPDHTIDDLTDLPAVIELLETGG